MAGIKIDYENNAEEWWHAACGREDVPPELIPLLDGGGPDEIEVPANRIAALLAWCESTPGWADGPEHARTALLFDA